MINFLQKAKENKVVKFLKNLLLSKFFPFILIPISLLCYYLSLDVVMIYIIGILGTLIFLFFEDTSPIVSVFLFMALLVTDKNSPLILDGKSDYYFQTANLVQIFLVISIFASAAVIRLIINIVKKKFEIEPVFLGLCAFAVALLLNGIFVKDYIAKNMLYGLIMALCFCVLYGALKDSIIVDSDSFLRIAYGFFAFGITLVIELVVKYIATENIVVGNTINRNLLTFGWGIWNTMGMYLVLCIPFTVYLAGKERLGFIFALASVVLFSAAIMSCSRQSIIGAVVVFPASLVLLFVKQKNKLKNAIAMLIAVGILIVFLLTYDYNLFKYFAELFKKIMVDGEFSGNGRRRIWEEALENFKSSPIFGTGFYVSSSAAHFSGLNLVPTMMHNTIMQILSSCGIVGLIAYLSHRVTTGISYLKNITVERTYLVFSIIGFLLICLFDNHLFNIFPTIIYACFIAVLVGSERKSTFNQLLR